MKRKLMILAVMLASTALAQTANAQRGITVYEKGSETPVAAATFAQVKSLSFNMPSVVMLTEDGTELQTLDIKKLDRIVISISGDVTAIKDVEIAGERVRSNRMYNILGQEVSSARGIVIKNGKKYIATGK